MCGTETISALHPGAGLDMTVGTSGVRIDILDAEDSYDGMKIIR